MSKKLKIGIANRGVLHFNAEKPVSLEEWFKEVAQSKAFDYVDKTPPKEELNKYRSLSEKYDLPMLCGGWFYRIGEDDKPTIRKFKIRIWAWK